MTSVPSEELRSMAMALDSGERAQLAHDLIISLDGAPDADAAALWETEIGNRLDEIDRGVVELVDADEVLRRIRARVRSL
jgi:hypothetical protein